MSPTKNDSRSSRVENISLSPKSIAENGTFKRNVSSSKSKWRILAQAIKKSGTTSTQNSKTYENKDLKNENSILRYPSYDLIQCTKATYDASDSPTKDSLNQNKSDVDRSEANRRIWFQIRAKGYNEINLKVSNVYLNFGWNIIKMTKKFQSLN